jgi:dipeptidyl aminopeptidase/acylaminoacyl peptidase
MTEPNDQSPHRRPPPDRDDDPAPSRKQRLRRGLLRRLPIYGGLLAVLLAIVKLNGCAERLFYYPVRGEYEPPRWAEDVWFESEGRRLHGWFYPAQRPEGETGPAPTIVHCHGNAFNISRHRDFVEFLPGAGFNVLIFDYRSYGMSEKGPLRREGLIADAKAAIDYVMTRDDVDPSRVGLYGLSLGGTIGLAAAAEDERVRAVVSVATFSTWKGVAGDHAPVLGRWLIPPGRDAVDSAARLGDRPLLLLHGTSDDIVNHRHGPIIQAAAIAAGVDSTFLSFDDVEHVEWIDQDPEMRDAISEFFAQHLNDAGPRPGAPVPGAERD